MWATANVKLVKGLQREGVIQDVLAEDERRREDFADVPTFLETSGAKKPTGPWQAFTRSRQIFRRWLESNHARKSRNCDSRSDRHLEGGKGFHHEVAPEVPASGGGEKVVTVPQAPRGAV